MNSLAEGQGIIMEGMQAERDISRDFRLRYIDFSRDCLASFRDFGLKCQLYASNS